MVETRKVSFQDGKGNIYFLETSTDMVFDEEGNNLGDILTLYKKDLDSHKADNAAHQNRLVPKGLISMWSGSIGTIPGGWSLCDGKNNTPDLRNRFIVGAGEEYSVGDVGGSKKVVLTSNEIPSHSHGQGTLSMDYAGDHSHTVDVKDLSYNSGRGISGDVQSGATPYEVSTSSNGLHKHKLSGSTESVGSDASHENRPPYFALAYIMKL